MKKNSINLILCISIALLIIFFSIFVYLINVIKNKNNHISVVSITLGKKIAEKDNLNTLKKKMTELVDTQKTISGYLVDTTNIDIFVGYLETLGLTNNIELSVNSVDIVKNEKNKIFVNLTAKGAFPDSMKMLSLLENSSYNISIVSLYLNKEISSSSPQTLVSSGKINTAKVTPAPPTLLKSSWQMDIGFNVLSL